MRQRFPGFQSLSLHSCGFITISCTSQVIRPLGEEDFVHCPITSADLVFLI